MRFLLIGISCLLFTSCDVVDGSEPDPKSPGTAINKILPLGASRVEGARPEFESYRYELWKALSENGWTFDFIGTQSDEADYPQVDSLSFDTDHEGRGGWTSGQIADGLQDWIDDTGPPDIVLLSSPGGNDALEGLPYDEAVVNVRSMIEILQTDNPNVTILIEQMAPGRTDVMTPELTRFFDLMQEEVVRIAADHSTSTSSIVPVDMFTGFDDSLLADEVHYNERGAVFVANRYYGALADVLEE